MHLSRSKKICYPAFATFKKILRKIKVNLAGKYCLWAGFFVLFLVGAVYLFLFSPAFRIKTIEITGNKLIAEDLIAQNVRESFQEKYFEIIPADTIFAVVGGKIKNKLMSDYSEIENVEARRVGTDKLEILLRERESAGILCLAETRESFSPAPSALALILQHSASSSSVSAPLKEIAPESEKCFFVDKGGFAYREAPEISGTLLPTFFSYQSEVVGLRAQGIEAAIIEFATLVKKELRKTGVDLESFVLDSEISSDVKAFSSEGWIVYFDASRSALSQVKVLETILRDEIKERRATLQYIDLRAEDRVYYK